MGFKVRANFYDFKIAPLFFEKIWLPKFFKGVRGYAMRDNFLKGNRHEFWGWRRVRFSLPINCSPPPEMESWIHVHYAIRFPKNTDVQIILCRLYIFLLEKKQFATDKTWHNNDHSSYGWYFLLMITQFEIYSSKGLSIKASTVRYFNFSVFRVVE